MRAFAGLLLAVLSMASNHRGALAAELAGYRYIEALMGDTPAGQNLPWVIVLHYKGATPEQMLELIGPLPVPARVVLLQGDVELPKGFGWWNPAHRLEAPAEIADIARVAGDLARFIHQYGASSPVTGKPAVFGYSHGGDLAVALATLHPDAVASAHGGGTRLVALPGAMAGSAAPIYIYQGADDAVVKAAMVRQRAAGQAVTYREYPGLGHDVNAALLADVAADLRRELRQPRTP